VAVREGESVKEAARELSHRPGVAYARPNYIARASAYTPNDPSFPVQWNLAATPAGINMPEAWGSARQLRRPGGLGVVVAVLDTGVAYQRFRRFRRAPDLNRFVRGHDFVARDRRPNDQNGHGTHVAGTIAQSTGNRVGTAGIAYNARIMPVRVLDANGAGDTLAISKGIRFAARRGADVINLSLEFDAAVRSAQIPDIVSALRYARARGAVVIAAAGNQGSPQVAYPARARNVVAVAATTARGCQAQYSNSGPDVDLAAPGGGADAANTDTPYDVSVCQPELRGEFIYQQTFAGSVARFGLPGGYEGTSMASPHVSGVAALLIGSGRLGARPSPGAIERRLESTARDLGTSGWDARYGWGLLDAAAALR
jgi:serine protease